MTLNPTPRLRVLLALLACLAWLPAARAGGFPYAMQQYALDNGLKMVLVPHDTPGLVTYFTLVRAGSRNEVEPGHTGFAHFFEHIMFRGTEKYPEEVREALLTQMGADTNAYTSFDETSYFIVAASEHLPKIIELEADRFQNLKYGLEAFQTESKAVLGEYNKNHANPEEQMEEALCKLAFTAHPYQHTAMGFLEDIEDMPNQYEYSLEFFKRYYTPDNVTIFVVGDFDPAAVEHVIRTQYGGWNRKLQSPEVALEPPQTAERRLELSWPTSTLSRLMMGYKGPAFEGHIADWAALTVLDEFAFGETSTLYKKLVLEDQLALSLETWFAMPRDPGLLRFVARVSEPDRLPKVQLAIEKTILEAQSVLIDPLRLEEIKSHLRYAMAMRLDTNMGIASSLSYYTALTGSPLSIDAYLDAIQKVTPEEVQRVARTWLVPTARTVVTLTPAVKGGVR